MKRVQNDVMYNSSMCTQKLIHSQLSLTRDVKIKMVEKSVVEKLVNCRAVN